jgi:hypothetical protein
MKEATKYLVSYKGQPCYKGCGITTAKVIEDAIKLFDGKAIDYTAKRIDA